MQRRLEKTWPGWHIREQIGAGAYGKVYHITREEFGNVYHAALKVIQIPQDETELNAAMNEGMSEEETKEYFGTIVKDIASEITLMSRLKGITNIVSYEDHAVVPQDNGIGWDILIRMELLTPLYVHMRQHPLTKKDVIRMGIDICKALETCQRYNIIHRDIKPDNIFVSDLGFYKLGDFGIARQLEQTLSNLSQKGTYSYMAPEMYKGEPYNSTVDIYSLGIVLYRFLNDNRTPFMPPAGTPIRYTDKQQANILRISGKELPPPANAEGHLSEIVLKACAYDPKERYESAEALRKDLESVLYDNQEEEVSYPGDDELENRENEYIDPPEKEPEQKAPEPERTTGIFSNIPVGETEEEETEEMDPEPELQDEKEVQSEEVNQREVTVSAFSDGSGSNEEGKTESQETKRENKKGKSKLPLIAAILLLCIGLGAGGYFFYQKSLEREMPDFAGMTYDEAKSLGAKDDNYITVEQEGVVYSDTVKPKGVVSQNIKPGTVVKKGAEVKVVISKGVKYSADSTTIEEDLRKKAESYRELVKQKKSVPEKYVQIVQNCFDDIDWKEFDLNDMNASSFKKYAQDFGMQIQEDDHGITAYTGELYSEADVEFNEYTYSNQVEWCFRGDKKCHGLSYIPFWSMCYAFKTPKQMMKYLGVTNKMIKYVKEKGEKEKYSSGTVNYFYSSKPFTSESFHISIDYKDKEITSLYIGKNIDENSELILAVYDSYIQFKYMRSKE